MLIIRVPLGPMRPAGPLPNETGPLAQGPNAAGSLAQGPNEASHFPFPSIVAQVLYLRACVLARS